jgi:hypothetical protein
VYSFYELSQRVRLKYGELAAVQLTQHNSLVQIINAALGGKTDNTGPSAPPSKDTITPGAANLEAAVAKINSVLSF